MACTGCEQRRQAMKAWLTAKAEHVARFARLRKPDAEPATELQPDEGGGAKALGPVRRPKGRAKQAG